MKSRPLTLSAWHYSVAAIMFVAAGLIASGRGVGQARQYVVTELSPGVPCKLNSFGDIAGRTGGAFEGTLRAAVWNRSNFRSKHLGTLLVSDYSSASSVNDVGEVVGVSNTGSAIVPILWTGKGGVSRIPLLPGDVCGQAAAINKSGHIVGYSSGASGIKAFLWARNTGVRKLGILPGGMCSTARGVNDSDEVVGRSGSSNGDRAVLWTKAGDVLDLGTLPGDSASEAVAINNSGDVVGSSKGPGGLRAFIWSRAGGMQELGVLPGGDNSTAADINDSGEVVGSSTSAEGDHAFIWTKQGGIADLNSAVSAALGFVFIEAHAINARGQILAMGRSANDSVMSSGMSSEHNQVCAPAPPASFLLTPVSTP